MSRIALTLLFTSLAVAALLAGCTSALISPSDGLPSLTSLPNTIGLNVFFVDRPANDRLLGPELWQSVDENRFEPQQHEALKQNGIRIGIVGGAMPAPLETLLSRADPAAGPSPGTQVAASLDRSEPPAVADLMPLKSSLEAGPSALQMILPEGMPGKLVAGEPFPKCTVLLDHDGVRARTFTDARFLYHITPVALSDTSAKLELRPEIHHGPVSIQYQQVFDNMGSPLGQKVETFPDLTCAVTLAPGEMILLTMWPDAEQSLGWHFFSHRSGGSVNQRLIVVRVTKLPAPGHLFAER